jgi:hypothetical protein
MSIQTYQLDQLTPIIKEIFPAKTCTQLYCRFNFNSFNSAYNQSSGLLSGNNYMFKQLRKFARGGSGSDSDMDDMGNEFDFSSPANYMYYNTDKKEY